MVVKLFTDAEGKHRGTVDGRDCRRFAVIDTAGTSAQKAAERRVSSMTRANEGARQYIAGRRGVHQLQNRPTREQRFAIRDLREAVELATRRPCRNYNPCMM